MSLFEHVPHPHVTARSEAGPVRVADQHPVGNPVSRFNTRLALIITKAVGSMWCAYAFALFDMISLPTAIQGGAATIVSWIAQTFLQLVLLSIIMVGQDVQARASDRRAAQTYDDAEAILHGLEQQALHLAAQDAVVATIQAHLEQQDAHLERQDTAVGELVDQLHNALASLPPRS